MAKNSILREAVNDDDSLSLLLACMKEFEEAFCRNMFRSKEFSLKLDVHGAKGRIIHCRVVDDYTARPVYVHNPKNQSR